MIDLGPLEVSPDPVAQRVLSERAQAERRELFRIAGQNALDRSRGGRDLNPDARADALRWASAEPLGRPLGTGEPA